MSNNINSPSSNSSSPTKEEIIRGLNDDLSREYKAIIQYVVFSAKLKGAEYGDIADQLKIHATQELSHALEIAEEFDQALESQSLERIKALLDKVLEENTDG